MLRRAISVLFQKCYGGLRLGEVSRTTSALGVSTSRKQVSSSGTKIERKKAVGLPFGRQLGRRACEARAAEGDRGSSNRSSRRTARPGTASWQPRYERQKPPAKYRRATVFCARSVAVGEAAGELRARADAQLGVGVLEVHLDRADGDEEALRDLLVRQPFGCELRDALLRGGQLAARLRPPAADAVVLGARLTRPAGRAQLVELGRRCVERRLVRRPTSSAAAAPVRG